MSVIREIVSGGWRVRLDVSKQVLSVEVPEIMHWGQTSSPDEVLSPTLPYLAGAPVPAAALLFKAKQCDDGLYAAVELAAQHGAGHFAGKTWLLRSLAEALAAE